MLAITVIPLQIFLKSVLEEKENAILINLQSAQRDKIWLQRFLSMVMGMADVNFTLFSGMMLFLISDSLIAFKTSMVYCFGLYMIVILKLFYESPRPFWNSTEIVTFEGYCDFDFASPGNHVFSLCFFWTYTIFMYFQKYIEENKINYKLVVSLYSVLGVMTLLTFYGTFLFGVVYIYQNIVSLLYSITFFIIIVNFDA